MASNEEHAVTHGLTDVDAKSVTPDVHPRILARMRSNRLTQKQDALARFGQLIDSLDRISRVPNPFVIPVGMLAEILRGLHNQWGAMVAEESRFLIFQHHINQYMLQIKPALLEVLRHTSLSGSRQNGGGEPETALKPCSSAQLITAQILEEFDNTVSPSPCVSHVNSR
jgi:hypothetical protein